VSDWPAKRTAPRLVSVVVPAYNAAATLAEALEALAGQDYDGPYEVVVADNGSTDGTAAVASRAAPALDVTLVDASHVAQGAGPARNAGVAVSRGDLIAFADADDVADEGWLRALVAAAPRFDLVAGPYEYESLNSPVVQRWPKPWPMDRIPVSEGFLRFALGGNLAVWRDVFDSLGGFAAGRSKDVEFSWRAQFAGGRLGFAREAVMHHRSRSEMRAYARQRYGWGKASCRLYRQFRPQGLRRRPLSIAMFDYAWWLAKTPLILFDAGVRGAWVGWLAGTAGRIRGNVRYRVFYP
jgi:glycosyltransferase involved in cell wall biosynthesis